MGVTLLLAPQQASPILCSMVSPVVSSAESHEPQSMKEYVQCKDLGRYVPIMFLPYSFGLAVFGTPVAPIHCLEVCPQSEGLYEGPPLGGSWDLATYAWAYHKPSYKLLLSLIRFQVGRTQSHYVIYVFIYIYIYVYIP